jgi:PTS system mannose-specific IIA component
MVGIIIAAHVQLAEELLKAAEMITDRQLDNFKTVSINPSDHPEKARKKILAAVKSIDTGEGVLILVDMFGGTPSNLSLSLLAEGKIEIITGVNLPMIIEAADKSQKETLAELVNVLSLSGREGVRSASEILSKGVKEREDA